MGRPAKDPVLHQLANELKDVCFEQDDALTIEAEELYQEGELRNVHLMKDARTYCVRLYVGGAKRVIGLTEDLTAACRFADMARMRFWIYRTRDAREPVRSDLHFEIDQVKHDLANETQAQHLLDKIELHLKDKGIIENFTNANEARERAKERDARRTVRDDINLRFNEVSEQLEGIKTFLREIRAEVASFKRSRFNTAHVDIEDAEVVSSTPEQSNMSTQEAILVKFDVCVPNPFKEGEIAHRVTVDVPAKIQNGMEILLPAAHEIIERVKRIEVQKLMAAAIENPQHIEVTPIGVNSDSVAELFEPPTTEKI